MKYLVTGAAGFIGSHVARALIERGEIVIGLDNFNEYYSTRQKEWNATRLAAMYPRTFRMIRGDILDERLLSDLFRAERFDKVCHLAARAGVRPSIAEPLLYEQTNVRGTLLLLEQSSRNDIQMFVYASSSSVYGECRTAPFSESLTLHPISPYAATKLANENDAYVFSSLYGLRTVGLRFFTVYGSSGRPDMAPFSFTKWICEETPVTKYGDGMTSRDYTYIDDIVSGVVAALDSECQCDVFNLGNSSPVLLNEFLALVEKLVGKKAIIKSLPLQPGDVTRTFADISHAQNILGFDPKTSLEVGMGKFVEWYRGFTL